MLIQIVSTSSEVKPTAKGSYTQLEVVYKNLTFQGKIEAKKLMSFGANQGAFTTLSTAQQGSQWEVTPVKNTQGYLDWVSVSPSDGSAAVQGAGTPPQAMLASKAAVSPKSTYETPEERAQRQILIVRQSSVSAAVSTLSVGAKAVKPADVIAVAKQYEAYVFGMEALTKASAGASGFEDLPDFDVPEVM